MTELVVRSLGGALRARVVPLTLDARRVVESQHVVSTRKLVDSDAEQRLLEELIDGVKPPVPVGDEFRGLHYLLSTPFRHPPLRWGSRFGAPTERGIWYGSAELVTCFAEVAYYRLLFLEGSRAHLAPVTVELTSFVAALRAHRGVDLTRAPFVRHRAALASKTSYAATRALGAELRAAGVDVVLSRSARAREAGINVALFTPAFARPSPRQLEAWICTADRDKVELSRKSLSRRRGEGYRFPRGDFEVDGRLPAPG